MPETAPEAWRRRRPFITGALARATGGHAIEDVEAGLYRELRASTSE
jgi:hypothetical protein